MDDQALIEGSAVFRDEDDPVGGDKTWNSGRHSL